MKDVVGETQVLDDDRAAEVAPGPGGTGRTGGLDAAVARLRCELAGYPRPLPDRAVAEDALDALTRCASQPAPDTEQLRHFLLLAVAALGSVSALAGELEALRAAVEELAGPR